MKLTSKDRAVLAAYQSLGDQSVRATAKQLRTTESVVRHTLFKATQAGVLQRRVFTNHFDLGLQQYAVFFSLETKIAQKKARAREILLKAPFVELLLEVGGRFHFGVVLVVRSIYDLEKFFDFVAVKGGIEILDLHLQIRSGWYYFGMKYIAANQTPKPLKIVPSGKQISLSKEEANILQAYSTSMEGNREKMARSVGIPASTLNYQIERLEKLGVIAGVRYQIAHGSLGHQAFRLLVMTNVPLSSQRTKIFDWAAAHPLVVSLMQGIGPWQYELRVEAPGNAAATEVADSLAEALADFVRHIEVIPVSRVLKMQLYPDPELFVSKQ